MSSRVQCPGCSVSLAVAASVTPGKSIRCPKCDTRFTVPDPEVVEDGFEVVDESPAPRPRRRRRKKQSSQSAGAVIAVLSVGLFVAAAAVVGYHVLFKARGPAVANRHRVPDVVPASGVGTSIGQLVPEIEGEDIDGARFKLSDYRGKVVVLDFWGHW